MFLKAEFFIRMLIHTTTSVTDLRVAIYWLARPFSFSSK